MGEGKIRPVVPDFVFGERIGKGGFGKVYKATDKGSGKTCAIKVMSRQWLKERGLMRRVAQEIKLHRKLAHAHVVRLYSYFEDQKQIYLVMEYCSNGNLFQYLRRKPVQPLTTVKKWFREVVQAVAYLHETDIVHRDIKLSNVLLSEDGAAKVRIASVCKERICFLLIF